VDFAFAIYQSKGASEPMADFLVQQNVDASVTSLKKDKPLGPHSIMTTRGLVTPETVFTYVDKVLDSVYGRKKRRTSNSPSNEVPPPNRFPSRGAGFWGRRSDGGAVGEILRHGLENIFGENHMFLATDFLIGYVCGPKGAFEIRGPMDPLDYQEIIDDSHAYARQISLVQCRPIGLIEPFKVRVITMGDEAVYHLARRYQPRLWKPLHNFRASRLVGETTKDGAMIDFASKLGRGSRDLLISGDYKAATDHLPSELSEYWLEGAMERTNVPFEDRPAMLAALTRHLFEDGQVQKSGQLMGSPVSFPVLCLVNLAVVWMTLDYSQNNRRIHDLEEEPVLVNGDDLLFEGDYWTYLTWKAIAAYAGLLPSIGKTLVSPRFCSINSQLWEVNNAKSGDTVFASIRHRPHVLAQLAAGSIKGLQMESGEGVVLPADLHREIRLSRKLRQLTEMPTRSELQEDLLRKTRLQLAVMGSQKAVATECAIGAQVRQQMWREFMDSCREPVHGWDFLYYCNRDLIKDIFHNDKVSPLCLPVHFGGYGFPPPPSSSPHHPKRAPTGPQLLHCRRIIESLIPEKQHKVFTKLSQYTRSLYVDPLMGGVRDNIMHTAKKAGGKLVLFPRNETPDVLIQFNEQQVPMDSFACLIHNFEPEPSAQAKILEKTGTKIASGRVRLVSDLINRGKKWGAASGRGPMSWFDVWDFEISWRPILTSCQYS
jgi:hypothetical protein